MTDDERPTPAELAARLEAADRPSTPQPKRLRMQWNVPRGVQPYMPLWFSLTFIGFWLVVIVATILTR